MSPAPRRWRRLQWVLVAAVLVVGVAWLITRWWTERSDVHYVTAKVTAGDIRRSVGMTGALNPVVTAQVGSYVSGNIKSWSCDYNTIVKIGQVCAVIDPLPFQVIVDQDVADVNTQKAQLIKDKAALVDAKVTYERDAVLLKEGIVSQAQLDTDKSTFDQAKAQINLDTATIASKKAALRAAEVNLAYTNILSPVNGMVVTRYIDVGQTVVSSLQSSTLFLIGKDMSKMQVDTNVSEADVGEVAAGQKAYFTVQAYPKRTFWGSVREIRRGPISVQNVVTYDIVVDVANADMALFPGMTADAHIITAEHTQVLRVPLPAIRFVPEGITHQPRDGEPPDHGARADRGDRPDRGDRANRGEGGEGGDGAPRRASAGARATQARLWLLVNGKLQQVRVRTGLDDGTLIEVSSPGLKVADEVVINATHPNASATAIVSETPAPNRNGPSNRQQGGAGPRF